MWWSKDHIYSANTKQQPIKVSLALKLFKPDKDCPIEQQIS